MGKREVVLQHVEIRILSMWTRSFDLKWEGSTPSVQSEKLLPRFIDKDPEAQRSFQRLSQHSQLLHEEEKTQDISFRVHDSRSERRSEDRGQRT
jgi:hypothetical protein